MRILPCLALIVLSVVAEDQWTEKSTLNLPSTPHTPKIAQLAEQAFRLVEPLADGTNPEKILNENPHENSKLPGKASRATVLAEAGSEALGEGGTWLVFTLPENEDFKAWLFVLLCLGIVAFSILFELGLHWTRHKVMSRHGWKHVLQKVEDEFFMLGIISFVFFFCNQGISDKNMITVEHFELAHYVLFGIGVSFTIHAIVIYSGMFPKFNSWAKREVAVRNPTIELLALTQDDVESKSHALEAARWAVVRKAYIDRYDLPPRFNYGEYLHQVAIDYIAEVMEATWLEWLATTLFAGSMMGIVLLVYHFTDLVDTDDVDETLQASSLFFIITGWIMLFAYYGVYRQLLASRHHCLELLEVDTSEKLMEKFDDVMNADNVSWPDGWVSDDKRADIMNKGWMAAWTPQVLSTFLLAFNFYAALAAAIFYRAVYVSHDEIYVVFITVAMMAPYILCISYLAPKCLGVYTEIHAFQAKDENVALELQEEQEEADRMGKVVLDHLHAAYKGNAPSEILRVFGEFDSNGDGIIDHYEFKAFMKQLKVKVSEERLVKLVSIVDPAGTGKISKEDLMYWLVPEDHDALKKELKSSLSPRHSKGEHHGDIVEILADAPLLGSESKGPTL
jgi:Ca2+-binding EF-hand superfamily protein